MVLSLVSVSVFGCFLTPIVLGWDDISENLWKVPSKPRPFDVIRDTQNLEPRYLHREPSYGSWRPPRAENQPLKRPHRGRWSLHPKPTPSPTEYQKLYYPQGAGFQFTENRPWRKRTTSSY